MNDQTEKTELNLKRYFTWFLAVICFVVLPALLACYSVYGYYHNQDNQQLFDLNSGMQRMTSIMQKNLFAEEYLCRYFYNHSTQAKNNKDEEYGINDLKDRCKSLKESLKNDIDFVIINKERIIENTTPFNHSFEDYTEVSNLFRDRTKYTEKNMPLKAIKWLKTAKEVLGSQFVLQATQGNYNQNFFSFCWVDSSGNIPPTAVYVYDWGAIFIFANSYMLRSRNHLAYALTDYGITTNTITGLYTNKELFISDKTIDTNEVHKVLSSSKSLSETNLKTPHYQISKFEIVKGINLFQIARRNNSDKAILIKAILAFLAYILVSWPIIKYGWNTIVLRIPGNASIRLKLGFLFFFATGIPLLFLAVIYGQYSMHKRISLLEEARIWSVENLMSLEQRFESYKNHICTDLDRFLDEWGNEIKSRPIEGKDIDRMQKKLDSFDGQDFYCIASEAKQILTKRALIEYTGSMEDIKIDEKRSIIQGKWTSWLINDSKIINIIGKKVCSDLNNSDIPNMVLTKLEVVAENIMQKSFPEIIYSVISTIGSIKEWGVGQNMFLTYFKLLSIKDKALTDYFIVFSWRPEYLQGHFIKSIIEKINRNTKGFKIIAHQKNEEKILPEQYKNNSAILRLAKDAQDKPTEELEILTIDDEEYLAVSLLGRQLNSYAFVGLYPMRNIENQMREKSSLLLLLGIGCLVLAAGLAQILTKSFVAPLLTLRKGALAIEEKNFNHRFTELGQDEFGEVSQVFNKVMVGLEELQIAKIVQESMFPKPEFSQGEYTIYGKTISQLDVGGDYLDFFKVDENSFSVLVGDVAGHGVGAAVIMAMAKSAVLGGGESLKSPSLLLNQLHQMILATKNKQQRKIMTFQYLHIDRESNTAIYANAGACSPCLIKKDNNSVEEIKMTGAPLGAFKKAHYTEMNLDFEPNNAIIFYTDGIVECKNKAGEMLGYDRLKEIFLSSWNENPEIYYNNIFSAYIDFIGENAETNDDLTIVVLMHNINTLAKESALS